MGSDSRLVYWGFPNVAGLPPQTVAWAWEMARRRNAVHSDAANRRIGQADDVETHYNGVSAELPWALAVGHRPNDVTWVRDGPDPGWDFDWGGSRVDVKYSTPPQQGTPHLQIPAWHNRASIRAEIFALTRPHPRDGIQGWRWLVLEGWITTAEFFNGAVLRQRKVPTLEVEFAALHPVEVGSARIPLRRGLG